MSGGGSKYLRSSVSCVSVLLPPACLDLGVWCRIGCDGNMSMGWIVSVWLVLSSKKEIWMKKVSRAHPNEISEKWPVRSRARCFCRSCKDTRPKAQVVCMSRAKKKEKSEIRDILNCLIGSNWIDSSKYFWFFLTFFFLLGGSRFVWMHPVHTHKPTSPGVVVGMSRAKKKKKVRLETF